MDRRRWRFRTALVLFVLWIVALGVLAASSGRRPVARPAPAAVVPHKH